MLMSWLYFGWTKFKWTLGFSVHGGFLNIGVDLRVGPT